MSDFSHSVVVSEVQLAAIAARAEREGLTPEKYLAREWKRQLARVYREYLQEQGLL
jgi:hypothetical protein